MDSSKIQVTERALKQRINKLLAKKSQQLRKTRSIGWRSNLGYWSVIDTNTNTVIAWHCNIEALGREVGALKLQECLSAE